MRALKLFHALGLLLAFCLSGAALAAPRVVVSVAPLHSLVSVLMQGVAEPVLLFEQGIKAESELDMFQKAELITADMLVWSGAGLETPLARALEQSPMLQQKLITLSNYLPLLRRAGYVGMDAERPTSRDAAFWSDPRLTIMAVRLLTPRLVWLDPDHQEIYLDNEIRLIEQLKGLGQEISGLLAPYYDIPASALAGVDQYFSHRYLDTLGAATDGMDGLYKVATHPAATCARADDSTETPIAGPAYYFTTMRQTAHDVAGCMQRLHTHKTAVNRQDALRGDS